MALARPSVSSGHWFPRKAVRALHRVDLTRFVAELRKPTRATALRATVDGVIVTITLKRTGLRPLLTKRRPQVTRLDPEQTLRVATAVDAGLGLIPVAPTCLRRSVTLVRELDRLGLDSSMHIGVRTVAGVVEAHAWVQAGGVVVNDSPVVTSTYTELAEGNRESLYRLLR